MVKAQVERYCNAEDVGSRGCTEASRRPDAQFQTETLFSGSGLGDQAEATQPNTFLPEVLSFDDDRITDARRFIDNAADPYPTDDLPKACLLYTSIIHRCPANRRPGGKSHGTPRAR